MHSAPVRNAVLCAWGINANTCDVSWNTANKISTTSSRKISSAYFRETLADHLSVGTMEYGSSMVLLPGETIIARSTSPQWDLLILVVSFVMVEWMVIDNVSMNEDWFHHFRDYWVDQQYSRIWMPKKLPLWCYFPTTLMYLNVMSFKYVVYILTYKVYCYCCKCIETEPSVNITTDLSNDINWIGWKQKKWYR